MNIFYTLSLNSSIQRYFFLYKDDPNRFKLFLSTILIFILINSIILSFFIVVFYEFFQNFLFSNIPFFPYILLGILSLIFSPLYTIYQNLLQTLQKSSSYTLNSLLFFIISIIFNVLFIIIFRLGAFGQLLSTFLVFFIFFLFSILHLLNKKLVSISFSFFELKRGLSFSIPLIPHALSSSIALLISQLILNSQISLEISGIFAVSLRIIALIDIIQVSTLNAFNPWYFDSLSSNINPLKTNSFIILLFKF
jgi:O-antigen/teichoic acid export membrane protein